MQFYDMFTNFEILLKLVVRDKRHHDVIVMQRTLMIVLILKRCRFDLRQNALRNSWEAGEAGMVCMISIIFHPHFETIQFLPPSTKTTTPIQTNNKRLWLSTTNEKFEVNRKFDQSIASKLHLFRSSSMILLSRKFFQPGKLRSSNS